MIQKCQALKTLVLPTGTVTNGVNMAQKQSAERKTKITPEYVNNKLEQILSALFDTLLFFPTLHKLPM